jgi:hypothetical protein
MEYRQDFELFVSMIVLPILRMKISLSELEKCSLLLLDKISAEAKLETY